MTDHLNNILNSTFKNPPTHQISKSFIYFMELNKVKTRHPIRINIGDNILKIGTNSFFGSYGPCYLYNKKYNITYYGDHYYLKTPDYQTNIESKVIDDWFKGSNAINIKPIKNQLLATDKLFANLTIENCLSFLNKANKLCDNKYINQIIINDCETSSEKYFQYYFDHGAASLHIKKLRISREDWYSEYLVNTDDHSLHPQKNGKISIEKFIEMKAFL